MTGSLALEVLLVEDSPTDALLVREALAEVRAARYSVTEAQRLDAAETCLDARVADVALLDLGLPDSSGLATFLRLRQHFPEVPVVVLTGLEDDAVALRAMQAGAQDYLPKDHLSPALLHRTIQYAIERHRVTAELRDSEERFRQLAESIREVFWLTDVARTQVVYVSPGYEAIWGRSCDSLYRNPGDWMAAIHPDDRERVAAAAGRRDAYDEEYRVLRPDGRVRWVRDQAFPVRDDAGQVIRLAGVAEDVTERRQLEAQLRQTQKLESIGLLAGGVAHDFNNWLTVISGAAELLRETGLDDADAPALLGEIRHATERASALTRQLLAFSRREVLEPRVVDLNSVVIDAEKILHRLLGEDILLSTSLSPELARVKVDPGQWGQILLNLAVNARDAMPLGGRLTVETRNVTVDEEYARMHPGLLPGDYVELAVSDTGEGMPADIRQRVFEPFFTTKGLGKGTGLGLSVVHGIATQSGGTVSVYSEQGVGTTFRLLVPVHAGSDRPGPAASEAPALRGTETILLVEDEESIRRVSARGLRAAGYTVLTAGNGVEALQLLEQEGSVVDLVVTDVVMPRMDGRGLAEALRLRDHRARILYTSGYTDDAVVRHGILQSEVAFITKPYTPQTLLQKIRQMLDAG